MIRWLLPSLLVACIPAPPPCDEPDLALGTGKIAVATATDVSFDSGTLTLVDLATGRVCDDVLTLSGDTALSVVDDRLVALDRRGQARLRSWDFGAWDRPAAEFSLGEGTNPHAVVRCGDHLVVSLYDEAGPTALGVFDDEGRRRGSVDLTDVADDDGRPEVSDLVSDGAFVWAGAQRLDRTRQWEPAGPGALVQVDCADLSIVEAVDTPENPRVTGAPDTGLLIGGSDGQLATWDSAAGLVRIADAPGSVSQAALRPDGRGLVVTEDGLWFSVFCLDGDTTRHLVTTDAYVSSAIIGADDRGWLAVRGGWEPPDPPADARVGPAPGLWAVDLDACEITDEIATAQSPYDLATY
jgi:hypothetical protein